MADWLSSEASVVLLFLIWALWGESWMVVPELSSALVKHLGAQAAEDKVNPQPGNAGAGNAAGICWVREAGCAPRSWGAGRVKIQQAEREP